MDGAAEVPGLAGDGLTVAGAVAVVVVEVVEVVDGATRDEATRGDGLVPWHAVRAPTTRASTAGRSGRWWPRG